MEPTDKNMRAWNEIHRRRAEAMKGELGLPQVVRSALGDLAGRRVLHLQCATGESSAELAELGALVTGVDISNEALDVARERWPDIAWVQADVHDLPSELKRGRFDLVYTADGVLVWLHDLDAWASGIAASLRSGGDLLLHEEHPVAQCVDESPRWREEYFDEELHSYFNEYLAGTSLFLDGRVTHELMAGFWPTADEDPDASPVMAEFARIWRDMPKIVFSSTFSGTSWNTTVRREVDPAEMRALKEQPGGDMVVGGSVLVDTFRVMNWSRGRPAARRRLDRAALSSSDGPACLGLEAVSHRE